MSADFRNLDATRFDNVKIRGMYEWEMKPLELIVNVTFSVLCQPVDATNDWWSDKLKEKFSLFAVDRSLRTLQIPTGWKYDGSRYTYGHDFTQVRFIGNATSLGLDFYFIQTNKSMNIEDFYETIAPMIAGLEVFQTTNSFVVRPNRKDVTSTDQHEQNSLAECTQR
jgi:hypothetical protein